MSVRLKINVLRLRQLSMRRLYDRVHQPCNLDLAGFGQEGGKATPCVRELTASALGLAVLCSPAGGGQVAQASDELVLAEARRLVQRPRGLAVLTSEQVTLGPPENALKTPLRRGPVLGTKVLVHGRDRA